MCVVGKCWSDQRHPTEASFFEDPVLNQRLFYCQYLLVICCLFMGEIAGNSPLTAPPLWPKVKAQIMFY